MESAAADQRQGWGPQVSALVDLTPLLGAELGWETFQTTWPPKERKHRWLVLCRSLADPFQEQGRCPPTPSTNSDAPSCTENPCRVCFLYSRVCQPHRGAAGRGTALHAGEWTVLRCISGRHRREGRVLFPLLVIPGADTLMGTQHTTSFCLLPRRVCKAASFLLARQGISVGMLRSFPVISGTDGT